LATFITCSSSKVIRKLDEKVWYTARNARSDLSLAFHPLLIIVLYSVEQRHYHYSKEPSVRRVSIFHRIISSEANHSKNSYLLRPEHIALHDSSGGAQFYIACAQLHVTNGENGTPGPLVSIPGVYSGNVSICIYCSFLLEIVKSETGELIQRNTCS
jgi:hypothetical protein